jgi:hypothetical protein
MTIDLDERAARKTNIKVGRCMESSEDLRHRIRKTALNLKELSEAVRRAGDNSLADRIVDMGFHLALNSRVGRTFD